ncbi:uncharacterized protein LOC124148664 isoform X1 [Haliotis rufescens]|uniref:uncharacterized protein LOC124148664 isoform X1 n=1 Tax=Haliotis rufescens TaxID=6454 RepID=UPI00201EB5B0|nr:uncharacterized protein LOC124148664 isoform X1 [Haliotis rufescens]
MGGSGFALGVLVLLCVLISFDGARGGYSRNACYFCTDTGSNPDCRDYDVLHKANLNNNDTDQELLRNCSASQPFCMIEVYIKLGLVYSYIRDCTSNQNDSFSFAKEGRLKVITATNITTCTFDKQTMGQMCLTICSGQFCNGPQVSEGLVLVPCLKSVLLPILVMALGTPGARFVV